MTRDVSHRGVLGAASLAALALGLPAFAADTMPRRFYASTRRAAARPFRNVHRA